MIFHFSPINFLHYFLKREISQFFTSIAIRYLALGMILIFEPIYLYLYFEKSLSLTLLFFGAIQGLFALLAVFGGKLMAKIGLKHVMLFSNFFYLGYYISLFFIYSSFWLAPLAIILKAVGMTLFWPAFHTDFVRFSEKDHRGREVGKMNIAIIIPAIASPIIGGWILSSFNYPVLFSTVLIVLFVSAIPLFLSREVHEIYTDSYEKAWGRIFKKDNRKISLALAANGLEGTANSYLWPLFMFVLAISFKSMGGIASFSLAGAAIFTIYMGRVTDRMDKSKLLKIGAFLTSGAWIIKYFVVSAFDALLAHTLYRIFRTTALIPFQAIFYEKTAAKKAEADEFIIYREIIVNLSRAFLLMILAGVFFVFPKINIAFIFAAVFSLGYIFLGEVKLPKLRFKK